MERTDWLDQGYDSGDARFLMLTAITHHRFNSPIWGQDEVRRLHLELTEIDLLTTRPLSSMPRDGISAVWREHPGAECDCPRSAEVRHEPCRFWLAPMPASAAGSDADEVLMRCLLVDDNEAFIETARRVLDRDGVMVTGTASNIAEALRRASELQPDVVLADVIARRRKRF